MESLLDFDLHHVVASLPGDVRELVKARALIVAGGYVRARVCGERPSDIDIFGNTKELLDTAAGELVGSRKSKSRKPHIIRTDNAITVAERGRLTPQFITRWLPENASVLIQQFDFSVAAAAVWCGSDEKWKSVIHPRFYADLAARRLHYLKPDRNEDAGGSLLRVVKFLRRGYTIDLPSLSAVVERLLTHPGPEGKTTAETILLRLRKVDPLRVVDGVVVADEYGVQGDGDA